MKLQEVAEALELSEQSYKNLESGLALLSDDQASKLSLLYDAPKILFSTEDSHYTIKAEVVYHQCVITGNDTSTVGYVNNQNNDNCIDQVFLQPKQEFEKLRIQIKHLSEQNEELLSYFKSKSKPTSQITNNGFAS